MKRVVLAIVGVSAVLLAVLVISYFNFTLEANKLENGIVAQYSKNQNVYDNGWKKVVEMSQVPDMAKDQLKELYDGAMKGRYGEGGAKALLQFITEQNPNLGQDMYVKIQQAIEIFRNEFAQTQTELVARRQEFQNLLTATWRGAIFNSIAGHPHIDLSKYDIVTSEKTEQDFQKKKSEPLEIYKKK